MQAVLWFLALSLVVLGQAAYPGIAVAADDRPASDEVGSDAIPPAGQSARYIMTFMKSNTAATALRSASVVSVTNQGTATCTVSVQWLVGGGGAVAATSTLAVPVGSTVDFCSRAIPTGITTCNSTSALTFTEGRAQINSTIATTLNNCHRIAVSGRVYYTSTTTDSPVGAITDSNIVRINSGNSGD